MQLEEIEVTIDANGHVTLQVRGVQGPQCLALTKEVEETLGSQITSRQMTAEAFETAEEQIPERQHLSGRH